MWFVRTRSLRRVLVLVLVIFHVLIDICSLGSLKLEWLLNGMLTILLVILITLFTHHLIEDLSDGGS